MIPVFDSRSFPDPQGRHRGGGLAQHAGPRAARGGPGLHALLAGRTSQHARASPVPRPSVVIGHVAGGTEPFVSGSGGIMLPNHSPLVIAEQFGTLASLYPGRIDLGLGRAPGTDMLTARALRRDMEDSAEQFPQDVQELQRYFAQPQPGQAHSRGARRRPRGADLAAGFEPVQRAACRHARPAVRVRLAFRARPDDGRRSTSIAAASSRPRNWSGRTPCSARMCSPPIRTRKRAASSPRNSSPSSI